MYRCQNPVVLIIPTNEKVVFTKDQTVVLLEFHLPSLVSKSKSPWQRHKGLPLQRVEVTLIPETQ